MAAIRADRRESRGIRPSRMRFEATEILEPTLKVPPCPGILRTGPLRPADGCVWSVPRPLTALIAPIALVLF